MKTIKEKIGALARRHGGRVMSFADQGMLGLSSFGINILLARHFSEVVFATVSVMIGLHFLVFGVHRSIVVLPYILDDGAGPDASAAERQARWWTINLVFTGCIAALLILVTLTLQTLFGWSSGLSWAVDATFYLAFTTPPLLLFEYGRRVLYQAGRTAMVALASFCYLLAGLGTVALGVAAGSTAAGSLAFAASGLAGLIVFLVAMRPRLASLASAWATWRPHAGFGVWQSMTSIPYNIYAVSPVVLVGAFAGPGAAAVFGAARTVLSPAVSIVSAVDSMDKPRAARAMARAGFPGLHASISKTRVLLLSLAGGFLGFVILTAPWVLSTAYGDKYIDDSATVRVMAFSFLCLCLNQPAETMLIVLRKVRALFFIRFAAAVAIAVGIWWGAMQAGVFGAVIAIAAVQAGVLAALFVVELTILKRDRAARDGL